MTPNFRKFRGFSPKFRELYPKTATELPSGYPRGFSAGSDIAVGKADHDHCRSVTVWSGGGGGGREVLLYPHHLHYNNHETTELTRPAQLRQRKKIYPPSSGLFWFALSPSVMSHSVHYLLSLILLTIAVAIPIDSGNVSHDDNFNDTSVQC